MAEWPRSILIVGCGNMGGAMLTGWLAAGMEASRFTIVDPVREAAPVGVTLLRSMPDAAFDIILIGVKPQIFGEIVPQLAPLAARGALVLSILAGIELETLEDHLGEAAGLVRIMPNLAAAIRKSPIALAARGLSDAQREAVTALMALLGSPEWIDESQFDIVTALAGSGPAFLYRFIDALAAGAAAFGLNPAQAERLALATVEGASLLAASADAAPGELASRVASPGGTTQAGLDVLDSGGALARLIEATLRAARDRSAELARSARS